MFGQTRFSLVYILVLTSPSICHMLINLQKFLQMPSTTLINSDIMFFLHHYTMLLLIKVYVCTYIYIFRMYISHVYVYIYIYTSLLYPYYLRNPALNSCPAASRGLLRRACWSTWPAPLRAARRHPPSSDSACVWPEVMGQG